MQCRYCASVIQKAGNMTIAVCFSCGETKFGAFVVCPACGGLPATEDEMILSLAMTDQYFDRRSLNKMAGDVRTGKLPKLESATREHLMKALKEFKATTGGQMMGSLADGHQLALSARKRSRWWPF